MPHPCDTLHELLADDVRAARPWSPELEAHLASCSACAALAQRLEHQVRALQGLASVAAPAALAEAVTRSFGDEARERRAASALASLTAPAAPRDLEGRVVAALHAGARADRAVAELASVAGQGAPRELDLRLELLFDELREEGRLPARTAPDELDPRVAAEVADLEGVAARHLLNKLGRLAAPAALRERVAADLAALAPRRFPLRRVAAGFLAGAAALALWAGLRPGAAQPMQPFATLAQVALESPAALSPEARGVFDASGGGALDDLRRVLPTDGELRGHAGRVGGTGGGGTSGVSSGTSTTATGGASTSTTSARTPIAAAPNGGAPPGQLAVTSSPLIDRISSALTQESVLGHRRVWQTLQQGDLWTPLEYVEAIVTDGNGKFDLQVESVLTPAMSTDELELFALLQSVRSGFDFRSRDFGIRSEPRFWQNYRVVERSTQTIVAGVIATVFDISRLDGTGSRYTIAVDPVTAVVLFEEELSSSGVLLARVEFLDIVYGPDLTNQAFSGGASRAVPFNPADSSSYGFELLRPSAPPAGFTFVRAATISGVPGVSGTWARLTYGDGVDEVHFLFAADSASTQASIAAKNDTLRVYAGGRWNVAEAQVGKWHAIALGKVPADDLALMLQSAVETAP
ncbi:MAG: hypothetical protein H6828_07225 [Planctomycetes bacterium]|nr:hypothetical protein [Planctomycetota bacterium]